MDMRVDGKTAIVTGSSAGLGLAFAIALAGLGASVVLVARDEGELAHARTRIRARVPGATVRMVPTDLVSQDGCCALASAEQRCDILVNNVGAYAPKPFFETSDEDWQAALGINLLPAVRLSRAYMPGMIGEGWGRVVNVSSCDAVVVPTDALHYGVAKAAILALSRGLAKLAGTSGVTVNAVLPGVSGAEWVESMVAGLAEKAGRSVAEAGHDAVVARYPTSITQRIQSAEEVANLVAFLCSPLSSATTGTALRADGGIVESIL